MLMSGLAILPPELAHTVTVSFLTKTMDLHLDGKNVCSIPSKQLNGLGKSKKIFLPDTII